MPRSSLLAWLLIDSCIVRLILLLASILASFLVAAVILLNTKSTDPPLGTDCPPDDGSVAVAISPLATENPITVSSATARATPGRTATPVRTTMATPTIGTLTALRERMEQAVADYPVAGRYAVAVTDLQTGETVSVNGARKQLAGCSINLFVLVQAALDLQQGRFEGRIEQVDELISATTWSSNAATARELYGIVGDGDPLAGLARVDRLIQGQLGLTDTVLDHPPLYPDLSLGRGDNWLTAEDANEALAALWRGAILTPGWRDYLLNRLATVKPGLNYLTGSLSGAVVSHKNGFFEYDEGFVDNDLGIVRFQRGPGEAAFAVTFLSEGVPTKYADVPLGQQLVQLAFAYFRAVYVDQFP